MALDKNMFNKISDYAIKWCVLAIVFAAPFSKSISEISISIAIALWAGRKAINKDVHLKRTDLNIFFAIFVLTALPSLLMSGFLSLSLKAMVTKVLKYVFLYFVITESMDSKKKLKDVFIIALLSVIVVTTDGFLQHYLTGTDFLRNYPSFKARLALDPDGFSRGFPTSCFPFPNDLAAWLLLVIFPTSCLAIFDLKKYKIRPLIWMSSAGIFYLLFLTKARAAWIGLAFSTVYLALTKRQLWLIILLVIAISAPFVLNMEMSRYIFGKASVTDRIDMWRVGWKIFKDHPIVGNGVNTFFPHYKEYRTDQWQGQKGSYAHNCYLQMAADVGLIGLSGFLLLIGAHFLSVARHIKHISDPFFANALLGMSTGTFAFLVLAFFDTNLYSLNLATMFWTAIGLSQAIIIVCKEKFA
jgi:O-antigen ligase